MAIAITDALAHRYAHAQMRMCSDSSAVAGRGGRAPAWAPPGRTPVADADCVGRSWPRQARRSRACGKFRTQRVPRGSMKAALAAAQMRTQSPALGRRGAQHNHPHGTPV